MSRSPWAYHPPLFVLTPDEIFCADVVLSLLVILAASFDDASAGYELEPVIFWVIGVVFWPFDVESLEALEAAHLSFRLSWTVLIFELGPGGALCLDCVVGDVV